MIERRVWEGRRVRRQKGSEDERTAGGEEERGWNERGGCSSSEVFTHVDTVAERSDRKPQRCKRRTGVYTELRGTIIAVY